MKLLRVGSDLSFLEKGSVLTIGNFDGMHLGHQCLLNAVCEEAQTRRLPSVLVCFEPQANEYFSDQVPPPRLMTLKEKYRYVANKGFDALFCFHFTKAFSILSPDDFIQQYLFDLFAPKYIIVGGDFRFGRERLGTFELLKEVGQNNGCEVNRCEELAYEGDRISSTLIRKQLIEGEVDRVSSYLGRPYALSGRVVYGDGQARLFGIPTANVHVSHRSLALSGVFVVQVFLNGKSYPGVANIGVRPTVLGKEKRLEVHLFDFQGDLYGQTLDVHFWTQLRKEQRFGSMNALVAQINEDCRQARRWWYEQKMA